MSFERLSRALVVISCCLLFHPANAQDAAPLKIGYVDFQAVASKSPRIAEESNRLEKEFGARKKAIRDKELALAQLKERFQKESRTMKKEDLRKLEDQILQQEREVRWQSSIFEDDYKRQYNQLVGEFEQEVLKAIVAIAKQENYDLILKDGVLISSPRVNLTERVLTELAGTAGAAPKKK
jgi:outer membrane protein